MEIKCYCHNAVFRDGHLNEKCQVDFQWGVIRCIDCLDDFVHLEIKPKRGAAPIVQLPLSEIADKIERSVVIIGDGTTKERRQSLEILTGIAWQLRIATDRWPKFGA